MFIIIISPIDPIQSRYRGVIRYYTKFYRQLKNYSLEFLLRYIKVLKKVSDLII